MFLSSEKKEKKDDKKKKIEKVSVGSKKIKKDKHKVDKK